MRKARVQFARQPTRAAADVRRTFVAAQCEPIEHTDAPLELRIGHPMIRGSIPVGGVRHCAVQMLACASSEMNDIDVRPSGIEGLGIFALRAFRPGETIAPVRIVREITPASPIREELGERVEHCAYPDGRMVLIADPERHVNHSCDPNAYERFDGLSSSFIALREISPGDEITIDYNINIANGTAWPCHCGATRCDGMVVGDYFLLPRERQVEYRPLLAEWFVRRHRERLESLEPLK